MHELLLLALSIAPGIAIVFFIYFSDKHEKEPLGLIILSFVYGGISLFLAIELSLFLKPFIESLPRSFLGEGEHAFTVAFVEESFKFLFVRFVLYKNKNFNEPFDGIVYAVVVGMGFATFENVIYVMNGDASTAVLRMFTAVPAHATFAIIMGYYLGKAKFTHKNENLLSLWAFLAALLVHGIYDYFLFISFAPGLWIGAFISLGVGFFFAKKAMVLHQEASPFKKNKRK